MDSVLMRRYDAIYNRIHEWRNERARKRAGNAIDILAQRQIPLGLPKLRAFVRLLPIETGMIVLAAVVAVAAWVGTRGKT